MIYESYEHQELSPHDRLRLINGMAFIDTPEIQKLLNNLFNECSRSHIVFESVCLVCDQKFEVFSFDMFNLINKPSICHSCVKIIKSKNNCEVCQ